MDNIETAPDLTDTNRTDNFVLAKIRSPITFFILRNDGNLRVAAIQRDPVDGKYIQPKNKRIIREIIHIAI